MDWKKILKTAFILYGIALLFGIVFHIFKIIFYKLPTPISTNFLYPLFIIQFIFIVVLIPLIFPFFVKDITIKDILAITFLYILVSWVVFIPVDKLAGYFIVSRLDAIGMLIDHTFGSNPVVILNTTFCYKYITTLFSPNKCFLYAVRGISQYLLIIVLTHYICAASSLSGFFIRNKFRK